MKRLVNAVRASLVLFVMASAPSAAALAPITIGIVPPVVPQDFDERETLERFSQRLQDALNRTSQANFRASQISSLPPVSQRDKDYYVQIDAAGSAEKPQFRILLFERSSDRAAQIETLPAKNRNVVVDALDRLVLWLGKNVRIIMLDFVELGRQNQYPSLQKVLPDMLAKHLKTSPRLVLLDSFSEEQQDLLRRGANETSGLHSKESLLQLGKLLRANYVVKGHYSELNGELYVHARCVSIETGENIVVEDLRVARIQFEEIEKEVVRWSEKLRERIEVDFLNAGKRWRYLAVSGFPPSPSPPSKETQATLLELIRTLTRKLQSLELQETRIRTNMNLALAHISADSAKDRLSMSGEFDADTLLTMQLDRTERDRLDIIIEVFDPTRPGDVQALKPITAAPDGIEMALERAIDEMIRREWISLTDDNAGRRKSQSIGYRGVYKPLSARFGVGLSNRRDEDLYLGIQGGLSLDVGLVWKPPRMAAWQWEVVRIRADLLSERSDDRTVFGLDVLSTVKYSFRPHYTINPYVGVTAGVLGIYRSVDDEIIYDAAVGAGGELGIEHTLNSGNRLYYAISHDDVFEELDPKRIEGQEFDGGQPGGTRFTIGGVYEF